MNINSFLIEVEKQVKKSPYYSIENFIIKQNRSFQTVLLCRKAIIRIRQLKSLVRMEIKTFYLDEFGFSEDLKQNTDWTKIDFEIDSAFLNIISNIEKVFNLCYQDDAVESFGCCHRFIDCSDAKTCIHPDQLFAKGCLYKANLEKGLIFYGQNRNI